MARTLKSIFVDMDNNLLKQQYIDACNAYLEAFCEKHGFDYGEAANSWVALIYELTLK